MQPLIVLNTVGLCGRHLKHAPRFRVLAKAGWHRPLREVVPAVTCTAQATLLTGEPPTKHGIVGNGWFWRDTGEVRFWLQSNRLLQAEPLYETARRLAAQQGRSFRCAKLFWWFNQGAAVDFSVTPKPHYGADGNKAFDITGTPEELPESLKKELGPFPFQTFWGPMAGLACTQWIGRCAAAVLQKHMPDLTLVYLPHLDYDTQRLGPQGCDWPKLLQELESACAPIFDAATKLGARIWVVNEYAHVPVHQVVFPNRVLREADLLHARDGPFGEMLDTFTSSAFAVCDHQIAHVYVRDSSLIPRAGDLCRSLDGVGRVLIGEQREEIGLNHAHAGDLVLLSRPEAWFAYPYWFDDRRAPDFARTVSIHAKPGYDPCELFFDPGLWWPKGRAMRRLLQKKLGFRTLFDVVPLQPELVKGSHGLCVENPDEKPVLIGDGPPPEEAEVSMTNVRGMVLREMGFAEL